MFSFLRRSSKKTRSAGVSRNEPELSYEPLEVRNMLATFSVANLNDSGAGSLRQALLDANAVPGADVVNFSVAGSIQLNSALPVITDQVNIDGTTAPGYASAPVVALDFNNAAGLRFSGSASDSALRSLALVDASGAGVKLDGVEGMEIVGNYIGVGLSGAAEGNRGAGLDIVSSTLITIGGDTAAERNVISANRKEGIRLKDSPVNLITGNYIGTDVTGTLDFGNGEDGILLRSESIVNVIGGTTGNVISGNDRDGVRIESGSSMNKLAGNRIGTNAAGTAALGNGGDGIKVKDSINNVIGNLDPISSIDWDDAADGSDFTQPVTAWQGIRGATNANEFLIVGTSGSDGLLYAGTIDGDSGTSYAVNYPGGNVVATSVYGPDVVSGSTIRLVGTYRDNSPSVDVHAFLFQGTTADLGNPSHYSTFDYPGAEFNYAHSTAGGLVVGNYDSAAAHGAHGLPLGPGHAYIYDINSDTFLTDIVFPGALSNTAYGIWHNGGTSYTIVGGYSLDPVNNFLNQDHPIGQAYMVDYDSATGLFTHWKSFAYPTPPAGTNYITHFEGISSVEKGVYTLNADSVESGTTDPGQGSWLTVRRNTDGSFGEAAWVDLNFDNTPSVNVTSSNSVYGNTVVGVVSGSGISYQATINESFQLSNVISGNGGNGITLHKASNNTISMNFIGTNAAGTVDLGNAQNGIFVTKSSANNLIGGEATDGNDPTGNVFARPPQGNLISGNNQNGVLINSKSTGNQLSGNFIGTVASGNAALGNALDGVLIEKADGNSLLGCTFQQDPFVFYNVISGNGGNGLRVNNADDTTIQANFFGMGADNGTAVGNLGNGVIIEGSSTRTVMGGPIPLGNVVAANAMNGIVVQDKASEFTTYNTFCGLAAFSDNLTFGNGQDGMLITSTGSNILIRTCVITRNGDDGIEVSGKAKDVRIAGNIIGLNTAGNIPMGNIDNGIEISGKAQNIVVGGPQPAFNVIPQNVISHNGGNGVAILGTARNNIVSHSYIGLDFTGQAARPNAEAGVLIDSGAYGNTIGSPDATLETVISGNTGNGIELRGTHGNTVINSKIGVAVDGTTARGNGGNGIYLTADSVDNVIGTADAIPANVIANNIASGIFADSGDGNAFTRNSIYSNGVLGIRLTNGANQSVAAPVLTSANVIGSDLQVMGTLTNRPKATFVVEFFATETNDASGRYFLGSREVTTDANGEAAFTVLVALPPVNADFITATATDIARANTSVFSAAVS